MSTKKVLGFKVNIIVEPDEVGFHAYSPALKGLHVQGNTIKEARENAREAAIAYLESLIKHGDPIPVGMILRGEESASQLKDSSSHHTENLKVACSI